MQQASHLSTAAREAMEGRWVATQAVRRGALAAVAAHVLALLGVEVVGVVTSGVVAVAATPAIVQDRVALRTLPLVSLTSAPMLQLVI